MINTVRIKASSQNMTPLIYDILSSTAPKDETVLEFEKGTYYFSREGSREFDLFSSGGRSVKNHVVFPVLDKRDLTIRGNGSEFIFCDRLQPFIFQNCLGIKLENFAVDYSFLRYAYGTVADVNQDGFELQMDREKFDYFVEGNFLCFRCGEDILSTRVRKLSCKRIAPGKSGIYFLYIGDTEAAVYGAAPNVRIDAEETKDGVFFRYREGSPKVCFETGDTVCLAYDNEREAQAFWFENCRNIRLEGITIYRSGGMGVVADICEDIVINNLRIGIKAGREEYYSTTADGIFLTNCKGRFQLCNSSICNTYDDAMNIHGFYTYVEEVLSCTQIRVGYRHASHWGLIPCKAGDNLHISSGDTFDEIGAAEVKAVSMSADRRQMVLTLEDTSLLSPGMLLENPDRMPEVLIEGNTVRNCPHMRLSAGSMTIRNNCLELNDTDIYINDLISFWGESGAARNVKISGNHFGRAGGYTIMVKSSRPESANRLHQRITIEGNQFVLPREKALNISAVRELVETNNVFSEGSGYDQNL